MAREPYGNWALRLAAVSLLVVVSTLWIAPVSALFICIAFGLGSLVSLSTMEELTGGQEFSLVRFPVIHVANFGVHAVVFRTETVGQSLALYVQFIAVVVPTESVIVFRLRSRLERFFAAKRKKPSLPSVLCS